MADPIRQLLSQTSYDADGVTTVWDFSFAGGYLSRDHVKARLRDDDTGVITELPLSPSDFLGDFQLSIVPPVADGNELTVYRATPKDVPLVNFADKASLTEAALDENAKQAVFAAAEAEDNLLTAIDSVASIIGFVATAEAAAVSATESAASALSDSVTADESKDVAVAAASAAAGSDSAASASATAASGSASAAAGSASAASASASAAAGSATAAGTSATNASNSATAASGSATAAGTSATNASNSATAAATSATNANNSAAAAAASAASITAQVATAIHGATIKATPVDADEFGYADSAASFVLKRFTWANLKAAAKTYFDTLYAAIGANGNITGFTGLTTPVVRAYLNGNQGISGNAFTLLTLNTESFDPANAFNATSATVGNQPSYSFCPQGNAGYYNINAALQYASASDMGIVVIAIYKNGALYSKVELRCTGDLSTGQNISDVVPLNGSTDYVQIYGLVSTGSSIVFSGNTNTSFFSASFARNL